VVQVLQKGYLLHDRVIRPALVTVAKAKNIES
jgi:molecular chaperone GrpE